MDLSWMRNSSWWQESSIFQKIQNFKRAVLFVGYSVSQQFKTCKIFFFSPIYYVFWAPLPSALFSLNHEGFMCLCSESSQRPRSVQISKCLIIFFCQGLSMQIIPGFHSVCKGCLEFSNTYPNTWQYSKWICVGWAMRWYRCTIFWNITRLTHMIKSTRCDAQDFFVKVTGTTKK